MLSNRSFHRMLRDKAARRRIINPLSFPKTPIWNMHVDNSSNSNNFHIINIGLPSFSKETS